MGIDRNPGLPLRNITHFVLRCHEQREQLHLIRDLNIRKLNREGFHPEIEGTIKSFELAFRMQDEIPGLLDLKSEPESMLRLYGVGSGQPTDRFGRQCLLA